MQYHKVTAISVTLTSWTWGTATFTPETGTSYALSSLPIGSKIAKSSSSLYVITNSSGTTLWSISLSESSWYEISNCDIVRWWVHVAISNTTLEDWDIITAEFKIIPKATVHFGDDWYWGFFNPATWDTITQLEVDDTVLKFDYDWTYVTVSNMIKSIGLYVQVATWKPLAKAPILIWGSPIWWTASFTLISGMPSIPFPEAWSLPSGNLNNAYFILWEDKPQPELVTIAYSESGAKIEWDETNSQFVLTNSSWDTLAMADMDYWLPPFKNLWIADTPWYSAEIENGLYATMMKYWPLAYVPWWDTGLSKINDMQPWEAYYDINSTHTPKPWSDVWAYALTTSDYQFLQTMQFYMINIWYDAAGNRFQQQSDLMLCLNISPRTYSIELNWQLMHWEPVKSSALQSYTVTYIPSDHYSNGTMCQINNGNISMRTIQASIDTNRYQLDCPWRIRLHW